MTDICRETAERIYRILQNEDDGPEDAINQIAAAIHEAMFRIRYCRPRCDSAECEQITGGD